MNEHQVVTALAPDMGGLDPQGMTHRNMLYTSGQIGMTPRGEMSESFEEQAKNAFYNLKAIVEAAGSRLDRVLKVNIYLTDIDNSFKMSEVYGKFFRENPPARDVVEVQKLKKGALIQVSATAFVRLDS
ncbi:MAG: Rid family hydrolase [Candidatus Gracilibacteria bacterium]|jgi:2-iminobutanoate/2-iminopropanoate deaminase|nr:Rid family hydrolase [Candidatus Gracilibacteria bacterium]